MSLHPAQKNPLFLVRARAELGIQNVRMRPELQRQAQDLKHVAAHALARLFGLRCERRKLIERAHSLAGIGRNPAQSTINRVAVRIDKSRKKTLALQVDALRT